MWETDLLHTSWEVCSQSQSTLVLRRDFYTFNLSFILWKITLAMQMTKELYSKSLHKKLRYAIGHNIWNPNTISMDKWWLEYSRYSDQKYRSRWLIRFWPAHLHLANKYYHLKRESNKWNQYRLLFFLVGIMMKGLELYFPHRIQLIEHTKSHFIDDNCFQCG